MKLLYFIKNHYVIVFLLSITTLFQLTHSVSIEWFQFDRMAIENGQYWRLLSAHLVHNNLYHFVANSLGLVAIYALFQSSYDNLSLLMVSVANAIAIGMWVLIFDSNILYYVGLSGVLHGLFAYAVCGEMLKNIKLSYLLFMGLVGKLVHEQIYGGDASMTELIEIPIMVNAHLYGAITGCCCLILIHLFVKNRQHRNYVR